MIKRFFSRATACCRRLRNTGCEAHIFGVFRRMAVVAAVAMTVWGCSDDEPYNRPADDAVGGDQRVFVLGQEAEGLPSASVKNSDINNKDIYKDFDFTYVWIMTDSGPKLRNCPWQ